MVSKVNVMVSKVNVMVSKVNVIFDYVNMSIHAGLRAPKILKTCKGLKNKQKRFDTE
jgi:hypothetical protein